MRSRLLLRRATTAAGIYVSAALGFASTIVAARVLGVEAFGLFAIVMAATGLFQTMLDLTVEEAVTKYGFRYTTAEDWGRLRRLFARALTFKSAGAVLAALALLGLAGVGDRLFGAEGLAPAFAFAALIPLVQAPEGLAATALILRGRYDVRGAFLALSMGLRLAAIAIGAQYGLAETFAALAAAQALATLAVGIAGVAAYRRFVVQSSFATGVVSLRTSVAPLLLGLVSPAPQVGFFRAALAPQQGFLTLSAPMRMILLTEQTRDWERGDRAGVFAGIRRYSVGAAMATAAALVPLLVFMPDLVRLVFGSDYEGAVTAARIVVVAAVLQFVFGWTKSLPVTIGRPSLRVVTHGLETAVLVPLVLLLGAEWGATGAAVAVLASTTVFVVHWTVLFVRVQTPAVAQ
jgi:O-antigen/teichoic acid export membrane protein